LNKQEELDGTKSKNGHHKVLLDTEIEENSKLDEMHSEIIDIINNFDNFSKADDSFIECERFEINQTKGNNIEYPEERIKFDTINYNIAKNLEEIVEGDEKTKSELDTHSILCYILQEVIREDYNFNLKLSQGIKNIIESSKRIFNNVNKLFLENEITTNDNEVLKILLKNINQKR